jgi:hypothetical protein
VPSLCLWASLVGAFPRTPAPSLSSAGPTRQRLRPRAPARSRPAVADQRAPHTGSACKQGRPMDPTCQRPSTPCNRRPAPRTHVEEGGPRCAPSQNCRHRSPFWSPCARPPPPPPHFSRPLDLAGALPLSRSRPRIPHEEAALHVPIPMIVTVPFGPLLPTPRV